MGAEVNTLHIFVTLPRLFDAFDCKLKMLFLHHYVVGLKTLAL